MKIIKNSKSSFSSTLCFQLRLTKKSLTKFYFLYIDLKFFNRKDFLSKEIIEVLLREAFYAITNTNEYNE